MPSRSSFSIRKFLSSPYRLTLNADEVKNKRRDNRRRSETSSESERSRDSRHSQESQVSKGSSNSTVFCPDSSFSITTPQAERGLTDKIDLELSQEEIDRIKAVVAEAAAAAAGQLRLRMDEGSESIRNVQTTRIIETATEDPCCGKKLRKQAKAEKKTSFHAAETGRRVEAAAMTPTAVQSIASVPGDEKSLLPRKKIRRVPQPIVVPPQPMLRLVVVRPPQSPTGGADNRSGRRESVLSDKEITSHCESSRLEAKNGRNQQHAPGKQTATCPVQDHSPKGDEAREEAATQHDEQRAGNSNKKHHENGEVAAPANRPQQPYRAANGQGAGDDRLCLQVVESDKHHNASAQSKQAAKTAQGLAKKASHNEDDLALQHAAQNSGETTPSSSVGAPKRAASSLPSPPILSLYPPIPRTSTVSSRRPLLAPPTSPLVKNLLPPPPPPRVSSYFGTRSSWRLKSDRTLLSSAAAEAITAPSRAESENIADGLAHLLYRDHRREPDAKKDSGIALNRSQASPFGDAPKSNAVDEAASNFAFDDVTSSSDAGSYIDLLQALAIHPEEAGILRRQTVASRSSDSQHSSLKVKDSKIPGYFRSPHKSKEMESQIHPTVECNIDNSADGVANGDSCITPTFTQPRSAPTPGPVTPPSFTSTTGRAVSSLSSPRASLTGSSLASIITKPHQPAALASLSPPSPKKQARFLPLRLNKGLPDATSRVQRKKSTKKISRQRVNIAVRDQNLNENLSSNSKWTAGRSSIDVSVGGSSRWALSENVSGLFHGRLFNRVEINETLPFEKLLVLRESRALAQKQHEESEKVKKAKLLQDELDKKEERDRRDRILKEKQQQQDLLEAEQALTMELQEHVRPEPQSLENDAVSTALRTSMVSSDERKARPLEPGNESVAIDTNSKRMFTEAPGSAPPPAKNNLSPRLLLPPIPMPRIDASQMGWLDNTTCEELPGTNSIASASNILEPDRDDAPDGLTPIEPFYLQDLPIRVDAAGVRMSVLLPVEEEMAHFATSAAQHEKSRQPEQIPFTRKHQAQCEIQIEKCDAGFIPSPPKSPLDEVGPFPTPPSKNPLRFRSPVKMTVATSTQTAATQPSLTQAPTQINTQLSVTDFEQQGEEQSYRHQQINPGRSRKGKSKPSRNSAATADSSEHLHIRDDATYVYLEATPFSLVMPTYRHGPIRLYRAGYEELWRPDSRNSYDERHGHSGMANTAVIDETLDWTAFQMAIMGGAGDLLGNSVNYGQSTASLADEPDLLDEWFTSLNIRSEQLFKCAKDDKGWVQPTASVSAAPQPHAPIITSATSAMPAVASATLTPRRVTDPHQQVHTHRTLRTAGTQWCSFDGSTHIGATSGAAPAIGASLQNHSHHRTATTTSIGTEAFWYSDTSSIYEFGHQYSTEAAGLALASNISRSDSTPASSYADGRSNCFRADAGEVIAASSPTHRYPHLSIATTEPRTSFASVASYESMPQSPMADLVMTRGADGKEYVTPMGYNLSHDLGDYLLWEQENVCSVTP
ncbi:hypothetical protein SEPCBS119000_002299 [Sporothrix epigloea]|uniref:Uncharacterized protein n=1 Tax=Sporothrix epigloea TaxID=1892477 RepID=A0ABP0DFF8_9PEZI